MDAGSPKGRVFWRGLALLVAGTVVALRLGMVACNSPQKPAPTQASSAAGAGASAPAAAPTAVAKPAPPPRVLRDPAFFPPTKASGGFYGDSFAVPAPPQQQAEASWPGKKRRGANDSTPQQQAPAPR
jgi:hypothetical protein